MRPGSDSKLDAQVCSILTALGGPPDKYAYKDAKKNHRQLCLLVGVKPKCDSVPAVEEPKRDPASDAKDWVSIVF